MVILWSMKLFLIFGRLWEIKNMHGKLGKLSKSLEAFEKLKNPRKLVIFKKAQKKLSKIPHLPE
jgi:hypothetical protein